MIKTLVLTGYGINCEVEVAECFKRVGSTAKIIHVNELLQDPKILDKHDILALPGGFSYGDHIACGKNFSNKIRFNIFKEFTDFIRSGRPVLGICNGYQILVKLGVVPDSQASIQSKENFTPELTFTHNSDQGEQGGGHSHFQDRWVYLLRNKHNASFWLDDLNQLELPVRHGEGRLVCTDATVIKQLQQNGQIALYYADQDFNPATTYPYNPNGSVGSIASLTNKTGNVLGIMPHPEAYGLRAHYPNFFGAEDPVHAHMLKSHPFFSKGDGTEKHGVGMIFFYNAVKYVRG